MVYSYTNGGLRKLFSVLFFTYFFGAILPELRAQLPSSWEQIKIQKKGEITVYYAYADAFIRNENGVMKGLEYEIMQAFKKWLENDYDVELNISYVPLPSFAELYEAAKVAKPGDFFASAFSITEEREKEVNFTPPYMPDIEVLVNSRDLPIARDTADFQEMFKNVQAITIPNTTVAENLQRLKEEILPDLKINYTQNYGEFYEKLGQNANQIAYVPLPDYLRKKRSGHAVKRQKLFKIKKRGFGIIYPLGSDWKPVVEDVFTNPDFQSITIQFIHKYFGESVNELLTQINTQTTDDERREIEILTREKELQYQQLGQKNQALANQRLLIIALIIGVNLGGVILILGYSRYNIKRKANKLLTQKNQEIEDQKNELISQTEELYLQKEHIEQQQQFIENKNSELQRVNKHLMDSIRTAQSIQYALLPFQKRFNEIFPEHFTIYLPKDIVSGDFYWIGKVNERIIVGVIDCTGHGVPGAFMTLLAFASLNDIINEKKVCDPAIILSMLHEYVHTAFQIEESHNNQPGMDLALCCLDYKGEEVSLQFAGAKRPLYYTESNTGIHTVSGDRLSIGGWKQERERKFTTHHLTLKRNEIIYLFTDGYADTPDPKRHSLGAGRMKSLMNDICHLPLPQQEEEMLRYWREFKKDQEQRDDIAILGIRL